VLAGGGAYAATTLTSSASPPAAGPTGQAATLSGILSAASSLSSATTGPAAGPCAKRVARLKANGHPKAAQLAQRLCRSPLARIRLLGGMYGEFTFKSKNGTTTLAYQRGVVQSVGGGDVVVKAADGTTKTWALESNTVVRQGGKKGSTSALAGGEHLFVAGPVVSGSDQARLIVIQAASGASPSPSSSPASSS
jgi:hypothetical protein